MRSTINPLRGIAIVLVTVVMPLSLILSCGREKKEMVEVEFNPDSSYTSKETNVITTVSDSGVIRYKIITATWLMYEKAKEPFWYFPDGIYLEKFDTMLTTEASIKADTAYYYERRKIWELDHDVDITNLEGRRVQTAQLFWDQNKEEVYSDSFYIMTQGEEYSSGYGFRASQDFRIFRGMNTSAAILVNNVKQEKDTTENDMMQVQTADTVIRK